MCSASASHWPFAFSLLRTTSLRTVSTPGIRRRSACSGWKRIKILNDLLHGVRPSYLPPQATAEIPGIEAATRIDSRGLVIKRGENVFNQQVHLLTRISSTCSTSDCFPGQVRLADPNALLITEEMAKKFFGDENPVGQTLLLYADTEQRKNLTITGVMKECPKNSSIQFQFLTHLDNQMEGDKPVRYDSWKWFVDAAFLKLKNPSDLATVEAALQQYVAPQNQGNQNWQAERYRLEALPELDSMPATSAGTI